MKKYFIFTLFFTLSYLLFTINLKAQAPGWIWAKSIEGHAGAYSGAVDALGNTYIAGDFESLTLNCGSITMTDTSVGSEDIFLAKLDSNGKLLWTKSSGGKGADYAHSVAVDLSGNIYIAGSFGSSAITFGSITLTHTKGWANMFIAKYDANGNVLWAKSAGGTGAHEANSIAIDKSGNAYVAGYFQYGTIRFDTIALSFSKDDFSSDYSFLAKYDSNGNVIWVKSSAESCHETSVAIDALNNVYVTGKNDNFLAKYDSGGNILWTKNAGGTDYHGNSISVDTFGNIYVAGDFFDPILTFGYTQLKKSKSNVDFDNTGTMSISDKFLVKYNAAGNVQWVKSVAGSFDDYATSVATDASGNAYWTVYYENPSQSPGSPKLINAGTSIVKYDVKGNVLWTKSIGGTRVNNVQSIAVDALGNAYLSGFFLSPLTFDNITLANKGVCNIFLAKLGSSNMRKK